MMVTYFPCLVIIHVYFEEYIKNTQWDIKILQHFELTKLTLWLETQLERNYLKVWQPF
jgi:hypothetical protein